MRSVDFNKPKILILDLSQQFAGFRHDHRNVPPQKIDQLLALTKPLTTKVGDFFLDRVKVVPVFFSDVE